MEWARTVRVGAILIGRFPCCQTTWDLTPSPLLRAYIARHLPYFCEPLCSCETLYYTAPAQRDTLCWAAMSCVECIPLLTSSGTIGSSAVSRGQPVGVADAAVPTDVLQGICALCGQPYLQHGFQILPWQPNQVIGTSCLVLQMLQ